MRALSLLALLLATLGASAQQPHVHTSRQSPVVLPLPKDDKTFAFVVLGDRTGGPREGIAVLAQAVRDINLLDPDLVMTVGDLVQGYNDTPAWLAQMREYKATMAKLNMPWYPVAGNHDIYMRGRDVPAGQHEKDYEQHFGPLWYAFEHKGCAFVILYSDEGDPKTGKKAIDDPACQVVSDAQKAWLEQTLAKTAAARAVFVFLHHPRWLKGQYGDDWDQVHALLKKAGNVTAVFAGHIHRARYDGMRDGIEYFTTAATGAHLDVDAPRAGFLHEFHVVTVREGRLSLAIVPVGQVADPRAITGEIVEAAAALADLKVTSEQGPELSADLTASGDVAVTIANPCARPLELTLTPETRDPRWTSVPDHAHLTIPGKGEQKVVLRLERAAGRDPWFDVPTLRIQIDYLAEAARVTMPDRLEKLPVAPPRAIAAPEGRGVAVLDGTSACLRLDDRQLGLEGSPFTVEGWLCGTDLQGRRGFVNKTEQSDFGLFVSDGKPSFVVHLGGKYASAEARTPLLEKGRWHHVAGVWDGSSVRLYVDGKLVDQKPGGGAYKRSKLPCYVGADVDKSGAATSWFKGSIDEVRFSQGARYAGDAFEPQRRLEPDAATLVLLHCDGLLGPWMPDASGGGRHGWRVGAVRIAAEER